MRVTLKDGTTAEVFKYGKYYHRIGEDAPSLELDADGNIVEIDDADYGFDEAMEF